MSDARTSLERIVPHLLAQGDTTGRETLDLHLARYRWALAHLSAGPVLDLACGVGYGSRLLAEARPGARVVGADLAAEALDLARTAYAHAAVALVRGDGAGWARDQAFAGVVSLETIEHVPDPEGFLRGLVRVLAPGGTLVASVPVTPSVDVNPHHRTDFTAASFRALGARCGLTPVAEFAQVQPYSPWRILRRTESRTRDLREGLPRYYLRHPDAAVRRLAATLRFGFTNRYLTVAWRHAG